MASTERCGRGLLNKIGQIKRALAFHWSPKHLISVGKRIYWKGLARVV